jgi:alkanesulfonate monooxygenase SsuD/methylene tetrahydromethanopterin reductase-like flavin-dependent oxidoreductase (luciferase family)
VTKRNGEVLKIGSGHGSGEGVTTEDMVDAAIAFAGTPDDVYEQIVEFNRSAGGVGNLLIMAQGGDLPHVDTLDNLTLFAEEVLPRLQELDHGDAIDRAMERVMTSAGAVR